MRSHSLRIQNNGRTKRCTEVAGRPFPDGKFTGRDIGDRERYATTSGRESESIRTSLR